MSYAALYAKGLAVGESDIEEDIFRFAFNEEIFEIPTLKAYPYVEFTGYFYTCPIDKLRELEREMAAEP
jgi:hypothetical protein